LIEQRASKIASRSRNQKKLKSQAKAQKTGRKRICRAAALVKADSAAPSDLARIAKTLRGLCGLLFGLLSDSYYGFCATDRRQASATQKAVRLFTPDGLQKEKFA